MRLIAVALAACRQAPTPPATHGSDTASTTDSPWSPVGTGPATGLWAGSCVGSYQETGTVGGSSGTPLYTTETVSIDFDPATLWIDDRDGALSGRFEVVRADLPDLEPDRYRFSGTRTGQALDLVVVGLASTSSTAPAGVFPYELELDLGAELTGDLAISDGGEEVGRVGCSFAAR